MTINPAALALAALTAALRPPAAQLVPSETLIMAYLAPFEAYQAILFP